MTEPAACLVFRAEDLLPEAWRRQAVGAPVRTFNPGLLRDGDGWIFAYRVVAADGLRRIALCRLDHELRIVADSAMPLTDFVRFRSSCDYPESARMWFADPRLYRFGGRVFIYWNSGWHEPRNYQFVQELDPQTFEPRGAPRELLLAGERRKLEKNWTLFTTNESDNVEHVRAIYSVVPHRVLVLSLAGDDDVMCEEMACTEWALGAYPPSHGGLRGGAPAVHAADRFWSFCHSVHDGEQPNDYRYVAGVYCFAAQPPFQPLAAPVRPLELGGESVQIRIHPKLNPAVGRVIYPCGAARDGTRWLISHGINDERCAISTVSQAQLAAHVVELRHGG